MIKGGCENESASLILLIFYLKEYSQKSNLSLDNKNLKWGEISLWNKCFSQRHNYWHPLEICMSKISLKYIFPFIFSFEHSRVIMNMTLSSHGFLFHRNINRRENKSQIPLIIITMRKTKEYIPDVQQKIIELQKLVALRKEMSRENAHFHHQGNN